MKTILIVDDEYAIVESLTLLLEDEGYRVVSACNGKDGVARLQTEQADLILADFMMPILDGRELVRTLRNTPAYRDLPVIMMSAAPKTAVVAGGTGSPPLEISEFLTKPFQVDALLAVIRRLIGPGG